jgi:flagellar protein FliO/FliZ
MTKSILLTRAVATATVSVGACLLAFAGPAGAYSPSLKTGGESTRLNLSTSTASSSHATSTDGASIVRTIVGLAIVIAVIWGLAWILKQVKAGKEGGSNPSSAGLASIGALTLGSGRTVHLVRAGNDFVLLGATEHGLSPIHRYTEEEAREAGIFTDALSPKGEQPSERSRLASFASQLVLGTGRASDAEEAFPNVGDQPLHSPVVGSRPDPMRAPAVHTALGAGSGGLVERLREMTVRR